MTEITGVLLGALLVVLAVLAWTLFGTRRELAEMRSQPPSSDPAVGLLKQELESVRREGREDQERLRREVGTLTGEVTRQLEQGMQLIQAGQTSIGARLDAATKVVGDVQGSLGTLQEATRRVAEIGREIQGLEQVLKSPKMRGGLGETLLERLLDEMLPREHWMTQHACRPIHWRFAPTRSCVNRTPPGESRMMYRAISPSIGRRTISRRLARMISMHRLPTK